MFDVLTLDAAMTCLWLLLPCTRLRWHMDRFFFFDRKTSILTSTSTPRLPTTDPDQRLDATDHRDRPPSRNVHQCHAFHPPAGVAGCGAIQDAGEDATGRQEDASAPSPEAPNGRERDQQEAAGRGEEWLKRFPGRGAGLLVAPGVSTRLRSLLAARRGN
ncbi:hypothetical protein OH76DRAFT_948743 [Lentinus brumalis]|uniref:Uncharacterized protein n=1 Tax=Lentinus brumalis TaxID=2498619 RepID=A0A371CZ80_9APHY|nr:hypothetical protein OH76DRAFT_948743 [Polyporus brumalis]